ncbi:MAG TPA: carboxy terminal-processing peptidase [Flavipsychrobacter sp.]|nr:carboxy terminal-processing peptidase [Flavipsychrobacter sp.]
MKNKILIPLLILGALGAFFSFTYGGNDNGDDSRKVLVMETVMKAIKEGHYSPRDINDSFSDRVYHKILDELDYEKKFFTKQDIAQLSKYEFQIDDEINSGSIEFYDKLNGLFTKRLDDAENYYKEALQTPFNFNENDSIQLNGDKIDYAADDNDLKTRWREYMKYRVLAKYVDLKKAQDSKKSDGKTASTEKPKTDAELEAQAREDIRKNQEYYFKRLHKIKESDRFAIFINAITNSEDPHTDYFPPKDQERFDETMSGTFFGIGAQLREDAGKIKIEQIITGSPCWKQGELKAGDEIMKVAQGPAEPVDVQGYDIDDVVQLIRGKKGTEVRLTVKQVSGSTKVIPIIRGAVMLDAVFAKSAIISSKSGPIGYIYLPEFYSDFQHINGRRCSEDVAKEVIKLKAAGVKGIILDLRNNGGGSLSDVVDMAGIFVGPGPVVQVKSSDAAPMTLRDDKSELYDGPMAVMVNQNSASASEIMAAALQDYKRAVIVGTTTYGKGTVQKVIPLDEFVDPITRMRMQSGSTASSGDGSTTAANSLGALKITVQKFYRINGGSTQLKGVTPDIYLPDAYQYVDEGERHDKAALKWDEIAPANYKPVSNPVNVAELAGLSNSRVAPNPTFQLVTESAQRLKKMEEDNNYSLNLNTYEKQLDDANATNKKLEELQKKTTPLEFTNPKEDMKTIDLDSTSIAKNKEWLTNLKKDIYISETVNIVDDMTKQSMNVNSGKVAY